MFARRAIAASIFIAGLLSLVGSAVIGSGAAIALPLAVCALGFLGVFIGWETRERAKRISAAQDRLPRERADAADGLVRMLDNVLCIAARAPLQHVEPIELSGLLAQATERHGRTDLHAAQRFVTTLGDRAKLENVFDILIANALSAGSRAIVRVDHGTTTAAVHIDDDGLGVPRAERARVFERRTYRRAPVCHATAGRSSCVTARQIARAHGGDIVISSSPEGGARFTVYLPLHQGGAGAAQYDQLSA